MDRVTYVCNDLETRFYDKDYGHIKCLLNKGVDH